jgi:hypothetical protein
VAPSPLGPARAGPEHGGHGGRGGRHRVGGVDESGTNGVLLVGRASETAETKVGHIQDRGDEGMSPPTPFRRSPRSMLSRPARRHASASSTPSPSRLPTHRRRLSPRARCPACRQLSCVRRGEQATSAATLASIHPLKKSTEPLPTSAASSRRPPLSALLVRSEA